MAVTYSQNGVIVKPTGSTNYKVIGGREYKTVQMPDGKVWLAENLDFKFCNIGGSGQPTTANAWYYNNDESTYGWNGYRCGLLYNWYAVKFLNDHRSELCPGWHVPTSTELDDLATAIGGASIAGTKLKADNVGWASSWSGQDDYGFSLLPAGGYYGNFLSIGSYGDLWTATESSGSRAYIKLFSSGASMDSYDDTMSSGLSLRLVRDAT